MATKEALGMSLEICDLISREKAIDATWERPTYTDPLNVLTEVRDRIKELPSAQPEQRWIACSERLPEKQDEYLVTWTADGLKKNLIGILEYETTMEYGPEGGVLIGKWLLEEYIKVYTNVRVIAWQPLPKPYKEGDDE